MRLHWALENKQSFDHTETMETTYMSGFEKRGNFMQNAKFWHFQAITISKQ